MARPSLDSRVRSVRSLIGAQDLYQRFGLYLAGVPDDTLVPEGNFNERFFRAELKRQRRLLEKRWGNAVRLSEQVLDKKADIDDVVFGGGSFRRPSFQERRHMTIPKPLKSRSPYLVIVPYDPVTREPLGAYSVADDSRAFLDAFKQIESILELRLRRGQKESAAGYRQRVRSEKINELKNLIQQLKPITDEIDELKAYLAELEAK